MSKPTKKQLAFIEEMCHKLGIKKLPDCETVQEASAWIQAHLSEYNLEEKSSWIEWYDEEDYEFHGIAPYGD